MPKFLFLAGSARKKSINKQLAHCVMNAVKEADCDVRFLDLADYEMPLYCMDYEIEHGLPDNVIAVKKLFQDHDGIFIASPEFNSSFTPLLKNTLDWISRPHENNEAPLAAYKGKVFALGATSPGMLGGLRGLTSLRMMLSTLGCHVISSQLAVGGKDTISADNTLIQGAHNKFLNILVNEFVTTTKALHA